MQTKNISCLLEQNKDFKKKTKNNPVDRSGVVLDGHAQLESDDRKEKLLGVTFQSDLKWHSHIIDLQRKLKDRIL